MYVQYVKRNSLDLYQLKFRSLSLGEGTQDGHQTPKLFENRMWQDGNLDDRS